MRGRVWSVAAREKSLRHEPVKKRPGEQNGPGSEEAPVRSGRCPPFQGRIFPPSSPGEKVAPPNRSVAAKMVVSMAWRWWLCRSVALGTGTTKDGTKEWPRGVSLGACGISLMVPRCAQDTCCTRAPYIARRLPLCGCLAPNSTTSCMYPLTCQLPAKSKSKSKSQRQTLSLVPTCALPTTSPTRPPAFNARRQPDGPDLLTPRSPIPGRLSVDDVLPRLV